MFKVLIIVEKFFVVNDIVCVLGGFIKYDEYYESDDFVFLFVVGYLLEIVVLEEYEVKCGKWSFVYFFVILLYFDLNLIVKSELCFKVFMKLMKCKDVDCLINVCDVGCEGELIFCLIV